MNAAPTRCVAPKAPKHWESSKKRGPNAVSNSQNEFHPSTKLKLVKKLRFTVF